MRELIKSVSSSKPPNMSSRLIVFRVGARREPALLSTLSLSALHWSIYLKESMPEADTSPEATRDNCRELCAGPFCSCSGCPQAPWVHAAKHLHGYVADANWLKSLFISRSFKYWDSWNLLFRVYFRYSRNGILIGFPRGACSLGRFLSWRVSPWLRVSF